MIKIWTDTYIIGDNKKIQAGRWGRIFYIGHNKWNINYYKEFNSMPVYTSPMADGYTKKVAIQNVKKWIKKGKIAGKVIVAAFYKGDLKID